MLNSCKCFLASSFVAVPLLLAPIASAQYDRGGQGNNYDHGHNGFSQGAYQGGRGGGYDRGNNYGRGDDGRYQGHGIGTGKGALIGGAGGAAVGAIFGGGLKGALIGGGAGAGIGAIAGHEHQQNMKHDYYRDGYGH